MWLECFQSGRGARDLMGSGNGDDVFRGELETCANYKCKGKRKVAVIDVLIANLPSNQRYWGNSFVASMRGTSASI